MLYRLLLLALLVISPYLLYPQIMQQPAIILRELLEIDSRKMEKNEIVFYLSEDQKRFVENNRLKANNKGEAIHAGFSLKSSINFDNSGYIEIIRDSLLIWRVKLSSAEAKGIGLIFKDFFLSEGSALYIYDPDRRYMLGEFNYLNNNEYNVFTSQIIPGETLIIEYIELIKADNSEYPSSRFNISEVIFISQDFADDNTGKNLGASGSCNVNVNCTEGYSWQRQKRGIARMLMRVGENFFWCSGSLINNELQNAAPYFLTASHCGKNATSEDMRYWHFYFNYERPDCENFGYASSNVLFGTSLVAKGPIQGGSDFKLLWLHQNPPPYYYPYYNGWSIIDEPPAKGVSIHHPLGDAKKISTYETPLVSATPIISGQMMEENSAWRVVWAETENGWGVTQGGSSGSPIFNEDGLITGTLSGGSSSCIFPSFPDFYGKMSYHWDKNGIQNHEQLALHLDPNSTGVETLQGYDPYFEEFPPPGFLNAKVIDNEIILNWYKPGKTPNAQDWHSYSDQYTDISWDGPERATAFDDIYFNFSFPVKVSKISHLFMELPDNTWASDSFRFVIYDYTGKNIVYYSPVLEAEKNDETVFELPEPIEFDKRFFIAVRPIHENGHPSSLANRINLGHGLSYTGNSDAWEVAGDDNNNFVFLSRIFIEKDPGHKTKHAYQQQAVKSPIINKGHYKTNRRNNYKHINFRNSPVLYKIYKNMELIHTFQVINNSASNHTFSLDYSFNDIDNNDEFFVTAVYDDETSIIESVPSNSVYIIQSDFCETPISSFPHNESFNIEDIPECWASVPDNSWLIRNVFITEDNVILPYTGNYFSIAHNISHEENSFERWLISPFFAISNLELPTVSFYFNTKYIDKSYGECYPVLYAGKDDNTFLKLWDAHLHPFYYEGNDHIWKKAVVSLAGIEADNIRLAFLFNCEEPAFVAIDNIDLYDAINELNKLSINIIPEGAGEVFGFGSYVAGESVTVIAFPNVNYRFNNWKYDDESLTKSEKYSFLMPNNNYSLEAHFLKGHLTSFEVFESDKSINVSPNPSKGELNIALENTGNIKLIEMYSIKGALVFQLLKDEIKNELHIDLKRFNIIPGLYFLVVMSDSKREVVKVIVSP